LLNWRPVVDYELREIEFERSEREQRMQQLERENARLAELNAQRVRDVISLLDEYGGFA
jgi:predicted nuclease with TOPRIM domain